MPVEETSGDKLIIRMTVADDLGDQAKKFMTKRLMPHNNDGDIWVLSFLHAMILPMKNAARLFGEKLSFLMGKTPRT